MKIALQRLKDGVVQPFDLPAGQCGDNEVLVQTRFSVISSGTELSRLVAAKSSMLGKAMQRPDEFKKVLTAVRRKGFSTTFTKVKNRLEQFNMIGYSSSGVVVAKGKNVRNLEIGDAVALAGSGFAVHAEYATVPMNLCARIPEGVSFQSAAYATIGSIALQGIRQLKPELGQTIVVIGMGLLGQFAVAMLRANGVKVIGVDLHDAKGEAAAKMGCDEFLVPGRDDVSKVVEQYSGGFGADGVLITASAKSTAPIDMAGELARKRAKVVIVGDIGHDFARKNFYEKELSISMSCSYGAGRYDADYELRDVDYPQQYVPWTISRNMSAVLWMVRTGRIDTAPVITHEFGIEDAPDAYQTLLENDPKTYSILFRYMPQDYDDLHTARTENFTPKSRGKNIGIIGVGSYARSFIIPNLGKSLGVMALAARSPSSLVVKDVGGCALVTTKPEEVFSAEDVDTVVIATRHSTHAPLVIGALENNKNVYVEKPMAISDEQVDAISAALEKHGGNICVGFNRRYSEATRAVRDFKQVSPRESRYTVIADEFAADYWALDASEGGIVVGEVIHFVDLLATIHGSPIRAVHASADLEAPNRGVYFIRLFFENGTIGNVSYYMGAKIETSKERIELIYEDDQLTLDGFKTVTSLAKGSVYKSRNMDMGREKLFGPMLTDFSAGKVVQSFDGLINSHRAVFAARRSLETGDVIVLPEG